MKIIKTMFIFLVLMSFFILSKANALSITSGSLNDSTVVSGYDRNYNGYWIKDNLNLNASWTNNFELTNINPNGYDYFIFNIFFNYYDNIRTSTTTTDYDPVDTTQYYCSSWSMRQQTYADGTQSNYYVCEIWSPNSTSSFYQTSGTSTTTYNNKVGIAVELFTDNAYWTICKIESDNNGISRVMCPINNNRNSINRIRVRYTNINWNEGVVYASLGIGNVYNLLKDTSSQIAENQQDTTNAINNVNNSINNNNVSGANQDANSFVNNQAFQDNTGLTGIITAPLSVINSLTSTCSPIRLPIPYLDTNVDIPCIGDLLSSKMGALIQLVKVVINGYICYLIGLDMFKIVKHARDPNDDRIEVLDL